MTHNPGRCLTALARRIIRGANTTPSALAEMEGQTRHPQAKGRRGSFRSYKRLEENIGKPHHLVNDIKYL